MGFFMQAHEELFTLSRTFSLFDHRSGHLKRMVWRSKCGAENG